MTKLEKYVKMIVNVGVNIQKGQRLLIRCPVDCAYFARMASEEAYKAGAEEVLIRWHDEKSMRIEYLNAPDSNFGKETEWEKALISHIVKEDYALLSVSASDPEIMKGVNPERILKNQRVNARLGKPLSDKTSRGEVQWTIASVPTEAWSKKVFPNAKTTEEAMNLMWDAIYAASRIDDNDPIDNWKKHTDTLQGNVKHLMDNNFKSIRLKNSLGTDLEIELPQGHVWVACGEEAKNGHNFIANIPTEEIFTAPLRTGVNGVVYGTKPLVYMGDIIDNFHVEFKDGKVTKVFAEKNQHLLEKIVSTEENADYLGEIALVPHNSPISQSGILFYNTLYDENASCHLAFGRAYADCVKGTQGKTDDELLEMGINQSLTHVDFMVGSADMEIIGTTQDGKEVAVFKNGNFAF